MSSAEKEEYLKNYFNLTALSPNKPIFLIGEEKASINANLYSIPPDSVDGKVFTGVQPAGYFNQRGFLKMFYCDNNYSVWGITLTPPEMAPWVQK